MPRTLHTFASLTLAAAMLAVAGCAWHPEPVPGSSCAGEADLTGIDWEAAQPVAVEIRDNEFSPMVFAFIRDRPAVLTISNADSGSRGFRAPEFFRTVAVDQARIGAAPPPEPCFVSLTIPPGGTAEVRLVALRSGRYDLVDNRFERAFRGYEDGRGFGAIYVD